MYNIRLIKGFNHQTTTRQSMKFQIYVGISASLLLIIIGLSYCFAETPNDITINGNLKDNNLENVVISFATGNRLCPDNQCVKEFQDTTFIGLDPDKTLSGTLKIEDKSNSNADFMSFNYYKVYGNFHLSNSKENVKTGKKFLFYSGTLNLDKNDVLLKPEFKFESQITLSQDNFQLTGTTEANQLQRLLIDPVIENATAQGSDKAKITIVEFGDYQAKYSANFFNNTESQILDNFGKNGTIKFLFKDFVINDKEFDKSSTLAARATYCASDQGKYWQYHDELFRNFNETSGWITEDSLKQFANNISVPDLVKFSNCLGSQKHSDIVAQNDGLARSLGLKSAPTFILFMTGKQPLGIVGAQPYTFFQQAISELINAPLFP